MERKELMGRYPRRPQPWDYELAPMESKVIFLNKENLEKIEGYKATVDLRSGIMGRYEIHIVLTGFSLKPVNDLFDNLKAMRKEEIKGT